MGDRGPAKTPSELLKLAGNPGHLANGSLDVEPTPEAILPECPEALRGDARKAWKIMSRRLYDNGLLTEIDIDALTTYCMNIQIRNEMFDRIQKAIVKFDNGVTLRGWVAYAYQKTTQSMPEYRMFRDAVDTIHRIGREFGMTPSARSRMSIIKPVKVEKGGIEEFMNEKERKKQSN